MTTPLSLEQRIAIAADFNTDRIEAIKDIMRDIWSGAQDDSARLSSDLYNKTGERPSFCKTRYPLTLQSNKQVKPDNNEQ